MVGLSPWYDRAGIGDISSESSPIKILTYISLAIIISLDIEGKLLVSFHERAGNDTRLIFFITAAVGLLFGRITPLLRQQGSAF